MEVIRNIQPKNNFLKKIESFAKNKIILIFDECTTGFRETFGAIYPKFKVKPNIVIFETLGNGYAKMLFWVKKIRKSKIHLLAVLFDGKNWINCSISNYIRNGG